jgi:hypothetical protein
VQAERVSDVVVSAPEQVAPPPESVPATWRLCRHPVVIGIAVTAAGAIIWILVFPRVGTDLAAGIVRAGWARHFPVSGYLFSWYGGVYPAGYSVLAPYLLALTGVRLGMAIAVVVSAALLAWLLVRHKIPRPRAGVLWAAAALWTELSAGRAAFTLGLTAAIGCLAVVGCRARRPRARWLAIAVLALLTSMLSSVAGLFLGVPAAAFVITGRRRDGVVVGLAAGLPLLAAALLPNGSVQPIGMQNGLPSLIAAVLVVYLVPRRWRVVRTAAVVYGVAVLAVWALPTPVGSNVERLGELLAGPVLAGMGSVRPRRVLGFGLVGVATWLMAHPALDLARGNAPPYAPQTAALVRKLRALTADTARVEAVPQYGHWESQQLTSAVWLARGWERQIDIARNPVFYDGRLTPGSYHAWLRNNAVRYVAISKASPDWAAAAEAAIVRRGQPWLVPVWHDSYWRLFRVADSQPLASAPGRVVSTTPSKVEVRMSRRGTTAVRVHWSPLLRVTGGAVLARDGPWISLTASQPGTYTVTAPY